MTLILDFFSLIPLTSGESRVSRAVSIHFRFSSISLLTLFDFHIMRFRVAGLLMWPCLGSLASVPFGLVLSEPLTAAGPSIHDQGSESSTSREHKLARRTTPAESEWDEVTERKGPGYWKNWLKNKVKGIHKKRQPKSLIGPEALTSGPAPGGHVRLREWEETPRENSRRQRKTQSQGNLQKTYDSQSILFHSQEIRAVEVRKSRPTFALRLDKIPKLGSLQRPKQRKDSHLTEDNMIQRDSRTTSLTHRGRRGTDTGPSEITTISSTSPRSFQQWGPSRKPNSAPRTLDSSIEDLHRHLFYSPNQRPHAKRPNNDGKLHQQSWVCLDM